MTSGGDAESFASAVLINTGVLIGYRWHAIAKLHRIPVFGLAPAWGGRLGFRTVMRLYEPGLPKPVVDHWRDGYDWGTRRALLRFYRATSTAGGGRIADDLYRLDRPALVIWGARNRFVPVQQAELQRQSFPDAGIEVLEGTGHYPHLDSPEQIAALAIPFLQHQLSNPGERRLSSRPSA